MFWSMEENRLIGRSGNETLMIEGWGKNALRVRATQYPAFTGADQALEEPHQEETAIEIGESGATVTNGSLSPSTAATTSSSCGSAPRRGRRFSGWGSISSPIWT